MFPRKRAKRGRRLAEFRVTRRNLRRHGLVALSGQLKLGAPSSHTKQRAQAFQAVASGKAGGSSGPTLGTSLHRVWACGVYSGSSLSPWMGTSGRHLILELRHHEARPGVVPNPGLAGFREITRDYDEAGSPGGRRLNMICAVLRAPEILIDAMRRICSIALATCETPCRSSAGNGGQLRSVRLLETIA